MPTKQVLDRDETLNCNVVGDDVCSSSEVPKIWWVFEQQPKVSEVVPPDARKRCPRGYRWIFRTA